MKKPTLQGASMAPTWSTGAVVWIFTAIFMALSTASTLLASHKNALALNENQILYLFSTSAQVLAGIYGLTLTGFIFFRNELTREALEDTTLTEAVEELKKRYFVLLVFISSLAGLTFLLSNLAISFESTFAPHTNAFLINVGQSAFATTLLAIAYFVFDVVYPERIEIESRRLQDKVDPTGSDQRQGDLSEFLRNYNQIETLLGNAGQPYQERQSASYESRGPRRISNTRLAEILLRRRRIDKSLFGQIRELITLRNSIIHGAEPAVSLALVDVSAKVLQDLEAALARSGADNF